MTTGTILKRFFLVLVTLAFGLGGSAVQTHAGQTIRIKVVDHKGGGINYFRYVKGPLIDLANWRNDLRVADIREDSPIFPTVNPLGLESRVFEPYNFTNAEPKILIEVLKDGVSVTNIWLNNAPVGTSIPVQVPSQGTYTLRTSVTFQYEEEEDGPTVSSGTLFDTQGNALFKPSAVRSDNRGMYEVWKIELKANAFGQWFYTYHKRYTYNYVLIARTHVRSEETDMAMIVLPQDPDIWALSSKPSSPSYEEQVFPDTSVITTALAKSYLSSKIKETLKIASADTFKGLGTSLLSSHTANIIFCAVSPDADLDISSVARTTIGSMMSHGITMKLGASAGLPMGVAFSVALSTADRIIREYLFWNLLEKPLAQSAGDDLVVRYEFGTIFGVNMPVKVLVHNQGSTLHDVRLGSWRGTTLVDYADQGTIPTLEPGVTAIFPYYGERADCIDCESVLIFRPPVWTSNGFYTVFYALDDIAFGDPAIAAVAVQSSPPGKGLVVTASGQEQNSGESFSVLTTLGNSVLLSTTSPQTGNDDRIYWFQKWQDGDTSLSRSITPNADCSYTAIFTNTPGDSVNPPLVADTYVSAGFDYNNEGTQLVVKGPAHPGMEDHSLVRFDCSGIPPGSTVTGVILALHQHEAISANPSLDMEVREITSAWSAASVKWSTKPSYAPPSATKSYGGPEWVFSSAQFPGLLTLVKKWVDKPAANYGAALVCPAGGDWVYLGSKEVETAPTLAVTYVAPADNTGDVILGLACRRSSGGSAIAYDSWQRDNSPYFFWNTPTSVMPIIGYSVALDAEPNESIDITVTNFQYASGAIADGVHRFYVRAVDANGNWGPSTNFLFRVDAMEPTGGSISINGGAASTWSPQVSLNSLSAVDGTSGVRRMQFSNDGVSWSSWEAYASIKSNWDLLSYGGSTNIGNKIVYVRYEDAARNESAVFIDEIVFQPQPTITSYLPLKSGGVEGSSLTLSFGVQGALPITYQWLKNGAPLLEDSRIAGVDTASLRISNAETNDTAEYSLLINNAYGSTNGSLALRVVPAVPVEKVGQWPGWERGWAWCIAVAVSENLAFIAHDDETGQLEIIDVSDPSSPVPLGRCAMWEGTYDQPGNDLVVRGDYAYAAGWGLRVVDVSDRTKPAVVGRCLKREETYRVSLNGDYAYVVGDRLEIINISDPTNPVPVSAYSASPYVNDACASGDYAYVVHTDGLGVLDVRDPRSPALVGNCSGFYGDCVAYANNIAYIGARSRLLAVDVTSPKFPNVIGSCNLPDDAWDITVISDTAYVSTWNGGMQLIGVGNPTNLIVIASYSPKESVSQIAVSDGKAYIASTYEGLKILDVSTTSSPTLTGTYRSVGNAFGVTLWGNYTFLSDDFGGLRIIDVSDPSQPLYVSGHSANSDDAAVSGKYAFVARYDPPGVGILNVDNILRPISMLDWPTTAYPQRLSLSGNHLRVTSGNNFTDMRFGQILDVTDPLEPSLVGAYETSSESYYRTIEVGNYLFTRHGILDIADPMHAVPVAEFADADDAQDIKVTREYAYLADHGNGLRILKWGNPSSDPPEILAQPQTRSLLEGASSALHIAASGARPLRYQWFQNGSALAGKTNAWLPLKNVRASQTGEYYVVVTNSFGTATSAAGTVEVRLRPSIAGDSSLRLEAGDIEFRVSAAPNDTVVIESSADLTKWTAIQTNTVPADGIIRFRERAAPTSEGLFYRVRLQ